MKVCFLVLAFGLVCPLFAEDEMLLTRQAEAYFEAKDYEKARELFESLKGKKLEPWQQARLFFNIGTTYLQEGNWERALREFTLLTRLPPDAFLINRALKTNRAILFFREGLQLEKGEDPSMEDFSKALYLFRRSLKNIQEAVAASCSLNAFLRSRMCTPDGDLLELRSQVKRELALAAKGYGEEKVVDASVKEGLPMLLAGVKSAVSYIDFLEGNPLDQDLYRKYLKLFVRDGASRLSLWDAQLEKLHTLEQAYLDNMTGLTLLEQGELDESRIAFLSSQASLVKLIDKILGDDPFFSLVQQLTESFRAALDQVPIQLPALFQIGKELTQVIGDAPEEDDLREKLRFSNEYLDKSIAQAKRALPTLARFYLLEARQWVLRVFRDLTGENETPEEILEDTIQDQTHALELHRLFEMVKDGQQETAKPLLSAQQYTLETAATFFSAVIAKEITDYPLRCQCKPWDVVIPLFENGNREAEYAKHLLQQEEHLPGAMLHQEKAVRHWKDALEALRYPEKEDKKDAPEEPEPPPPPSEEEQQPLQKILRSLQQMEQDDRRPEPQQTTPQQGLHPW